jgi:hypothetical protein
LSLTSPEGLFDSLEAKIAEFAVIYNWSSGVKFIQDFVDSNQPTDKRVFELLGDCLYNLAYQQASRNDFTKIILRAMEAYEKCSDDQRTKARSAYCAYLASDDPESKRVAIINQSIPLAKKMIERLGPAEVTETIRAKAYLEFAQYLLAGQFYVWNDQETKEMQQDIASICEAIIEDFGHSQPEIVIPLALAADPMIYDLRSSREIDEVRKNAIVERFDSLVTRIIEPGKRTKDSRLACTSLVLEGIQLVFTGKLMRAREVFSSALEFAGKTQDRSLIGLCYEFQAFIFRFLQNSLDDRPEERKLLLRQELDVTEKAIAHLGIDRQPLFFWSYYYRVWAYISLAYDSEKLEEKIQLVDMAIDTARIAIDFEKSIPRFNTIEQVLCEALRYKSQLVSEPSDRKDLLNEARQNIMAPIQTNEKFPSYADDWNLGVCYNYLGKVTSDLAEFDSNQNEKEKHLREASEQIRHSVELCRNSAFGKGGGRAKTTNYEENLADTLFKLYMETKLRSDAEAALQVYETVAQQYYESKLFGRTAPIVWRIAETYDSIGEFEKSSVSFVKSSEFYEQAAKSEKSLEKRFSQLSSYMRAWSLIEDARLLHSDEKYHLASVKLSEASSILEVTESFKHLSKHYLAFATMEEAEELSRKESNSESALSFGKAKGEFEESKSEILNLKSAKSNEEIELDQWLELSETRASYCQARKLLEDAKSLDKAGETRQSMSKYRLSSESLRQLGKREASEEDKVEVEALALSCDGWAMMKEAEYTASPELYTKAAELFLEAKNKKPGQKFVLSCLANSSICQAFAAGMKFKQSRDTTLYSDIKNHLGVASQYYEEAGFEIASDWTRATEALFDALAYLAGAEREIDPQKKTQMYHLAEKHLELSARRYGDIGFDKKRQEVLRHLKTARENRELLISPMEALAQSPTVSSSPVNFTRDQAVGLERFEVANLTGNISLSTKQTNVGSSIRIDIDLANIGKTPALLMKIDNIAPVLGFEIETEKNPHRFLESSTSIAVDLKGKRVEYLKAHEMSLHFLAKSKGNFEIKPKVLFVDELGKYRSYEFEAQTIEVKELGFMGWAKGK